jgi:hypothetical protein
MHVPLLFCLKGVKNNFADAYRWRRGARAAWITKQRLGNVAIHASRECVFHSKTLAHPGEGEARSLPSEELREADVDIILPASPEKQSPTP